MDGTSRHLCEEIARVLQEYQDGHQTAHTALRELAAVQALCTQNGCVMPPYRMPWENKEVDKWLPGIPD
jgi:hypothetical protein